jgi:streptogramin lyase
MEWKVPEKANPHDPLIMADGSIFYASTGSNELGQLNPTSGEWKKFPAKTPDGGPHGLIADAQGHVWFTAAQGDYIGHRRDHRTQAEGSEQAGQISLPSPHARLQLQGDPVLHHV